MFCESLDTRNDHTARQSLIQEDLESRAGRDSNPVGTVQRASEHADFGKAFALEPHGCPTLCAEVFFKHISTAAEMPKRPWHAFDYTELVRRPKKLEIDAGPQRLLTGTAVENDDRVRLVVCLELNGAAKTSAGVWPGASVRCAVQDVICEHMLDRG